MTVSERIMGAEAHWLMGRVMPREFLEEVGKYLHHVAPEREDKLMAEDPPIRSKRRAARRSGSTPPTSSLTSSDRVQGF